MFMRGVLLWKRKKGITKAFQKLLGESGRISNVANFRSTSMESWLQYNE